MELRRNRTELPAVGVTFHLDFEAVAAGDSLELSFSPISTSDLGWSCPMVIVPCLTELVEVLEMFSVAKLDQLEAVVEVHVEGVVPVELSVVKDDFVLQIRVLLEEEEEEVVVVAGVSK